TDPPSLASPHVDHANNSLKSWATFFLAFRGREFHKLPAENLHSLKPGLVGLVLPVLKLVFMLTGILQVIDSYGG
ncbi:MAG: hypothetical protein WBD30_15055, partial [Bacteroidota bacterium]